MIGITLLHICEAYLSFDSHCLTHHSLLLLHICESLNFSLKVTHHLQASLGGLPSLQHSRENSDLDSDSSRVIPQALPFNHHANSSLGNSSTNHTNGHNSSFQGKTMLEETRWEPFLLIVSPNCHGGHYFVGGNDPVCLVSKVTGRAKFVVA